MTDLSLMPAKDVIEPGGLEEYEQWMSFFYGELVSLNTSIYVIDQISRFPFDMFGSPGEGIFFPLVTWNFFDLSVVMITRLATDSDGDLYTLPRFKNRVHDLVRRDYQKDFDSRLRQVRFDTATNDLLGRSKQLRDNRIAHANRNAILGVTNVPDMDISELEKLCDALNSLLDALSFDTGHLMVPIPYSDMVQHPIGIDSRSDIERLLDFVVESSDLLAAPERQPEMWDIWRGQMTDQRVELFNRYRRKFNLPEA